MSRRYYTDEPSCCNHSNSTNNDLSPFSSSGLYILVIIFLFFGGGFCPTSFWGPYQNIYGCSGFNSDWCSNTGFTNYGANIPTPLNSVGLANNYFQP